MIITPPTSYSYNIGMQRWRIVDGDVHLAGPSWKFDPAGNQALKEKGLPLDPKAHGKMMKNEGFEPSKYGL